MCALTRYKSSTIIGFHFTIISLREDGNCIPNFGCFRIFASASIWNCLESWARVNKSKKTMVKM